MKHDLEQMRAKLDTVETLVSADVNWQDETDARTTAQTALLDMVGILDALLDEVRLLDSYADWNRSWMRSTRDLSREERQRTLADLERVRAEADARINLLRNDEPA